MKLMSCVFAAVLATTTAAFAQVAASPAPPNPGATITGWVNRLETTLVAVADAMPESAYGFVPTNGEFRGVRSFARQVKHAAAVHYLAAAGILGVEPPADAADERGPDSARTKAEIIKYLKDSLAYLRKAAAAIDDAQAFAPVKNPFGQGMQTRVGLVVAAIGHSSNHYGQLVEYLRMNGIVPPASR